MLYFVDVVYGINLTLMEIWYFKVDNYVETSLITHPNANEPHKSL